MHACALSYRENHNQTNRRMRKNNVRRFYVASLFSFLVGVRLQSSQVGMYLVQGYNQVRPLLSFVLAHSLSIETVLYAILDHVVLI